MTTTSLIITLVTDILGVVLGLFLARYLFQKSRKQQEDDAHSRAAEMPRKKLKPSSNSECWKPKSDS